MGIKERFENFRKNVRPTDEHIDEANRQTEYMIGRLKDKVSGDGSFKLVKVLRAGSNAKFTSLRRTEENVFDVDLGAYYSGEGATKSQLGKLIEFTCDQLRDIYPQKDKNDFVPLKSAARVKFRSGIKLNVDVAPIIIDESSDIENRGWIPRPDGWRLTSVTAHNKFVQTRTGKSREISGPVSFNNLVRMVKWWNNRLPAELVQPSIFCEMMAAQSFAEYDVTCEWQTSLRHIFSFMRRHQFLEPIVFGDYYDPARITLPDDPVIVLDSVNPENNVASCWDDQLRRKYLDRIEDAYDAMMYALSCEKDNDEDAAVDEWCRVFGDAFRDLSEEEK